MKRRSLPDTKENRDTIRGIGFTFTENMHGKKKIYVKASNADFAIIKELCKEVDNEMV